MIKENIKDREEDISHAVMLCVNLLTYAALGANGKTEDLTGNLIKEAVAVFFTDEEIDEAIGIITGGACNDV